MSDPRAEALAHVVAGFENTGAGGPDAPFHAARALRGVALACYMQVDDPVQADLAETLSAAIFAAAFPVAAALEPHRNGDSVHLGFSAAHGLVGFFCLAPAEAAAHATTSIFQTQVDHVALLADELSVIIRRRRIEARGDPLRRFHAVRRALAATADGAALH